MPLVVNGSLDYEQKAEYFIWLGVADPGGITRKRFRIEVEDVNEKPTDILITKDEVPENSPGGTVIGEFLVSTVIILIIILLLYNYDNYYNITSVYELLRDLIGLTTHGMSAKIL